MKKLLALSVFTVLGFICLTSFQNKYKETASNKTNVAIQDEGINFKEYNLEKALKEAKSSNKLVFVDAYTSWCGPCKLMSKNVFIDPRVGEVFNKKFVSIKVEMEKDADGPFIARTYKVAAYPTLLFLNGDGKVVKSIIGFRSADNLLNEVNSL